jgi:hypothetical protein
MPLTPCVKVYTRFKPQNQYIGSLIVNVPKEGFELNRRALLIVPVILVIAQLALPVAHAQITYPPGFEGIDATGSGYIRTAYAFENHNVKKGDADLNVYAVETPNGGVRIDRVAMEVRNPGTAPDDISEWTFWWTVQSVKEVNGHTVLTAVPRNMHADAEDLYENLMPTQVVRVTIDTTNFNIDTVGALQFDGGVHVTMVSIGSSSLGASAIAGSYAHFNGTIDHIELAGDEIGD